MTLLQDRPPHAAPPASRRSALPRALRALSSVLIVSGLLLIADAVLTMVWQEPLSGLYAKLQQDRLADELEALRRTEPTALEQRALEALGDDQSRLAFQARALDRRAKAGQPIGRIRMPRLGLSVVMVEGTDGGSLRQGPGHYPAKPLPGAPGTAAVAGHRTTYGAPFRRLDKLRAGDALEVEMPYGTFDYTVERTRIVPPTAVWVTQRVSYDRLVLTACHPLYSAAKRIVVFARLERASPSEGLI